MEKLLVSLLIFCLCITVCGCELDEGEASSLISNIKTTSSTNLNSASTNTSSNASSTISATTPSSKKPSSTNKNTVSKTSSTPKQTVVSGFGNSVTKYQPFVQEITVSIP